MPRLVAIDLACRRGGRLVFAGLGLDVGAGGALLLTGRNGCGKSTLLRVLALLTPALRGTFAWDGVPAADDADAWRGRIAWLGHAEAVKGDLSVRENLVSAETLRRGRAPAAAEIARAAERFDLGPLLDRPGRHLSAGQRRRAALARVVLSDAPLWLLDEPASGLDAASRVALHGALAAHRAGGGIAVVSSHGELDPPDATVIDVGAFAPSAAADDARWTGDAA
ncbi:MAG: heme ABC exporter ATP-binding protein CcmA [Rhodospirillales bacterium]|nr:heme ABC exporter ATP-binding protein CcmA [Rhodospirillales bacterium]